LKVTKLVQSEKAADKYYMEFEDGGKLTVTVALIADYCLYTGRELDEDEFAALTSAADALKAKARALRILGKRNMSRREITERLVQKGESENTAVDTADWLIRIGAVNDAEYAALIVRHYASRGYGKIRIRDELYRRGIERELWEDALGQMPETDEKVYLALKLKLDGKVPDKTDLKKATDALYRRGFSWDEIKTAVERYKGENEKEDLTDNE